MPPKLDITGDDNLEVALTMLESFEAPQRRAGLQTLTAMGPKVGAEHLSDMSALLTDEAPEVRKQACVSLGKVGKAAGKIVKDLVAALNDEHVLVIAEAARAIGLLGKEAAGPYAAKLTDLASIKTEEVGLAAVEALSAIGETSKLAAFTKHGAQAVRKMAVVEIGRSPEALQEHAGLVMGLIGDSNTAVRLAAVQASGELGDDISEEHLAVMAGLRTQEKQVRIRHAAVMALGKIGKSAVAQLVSFLQDEDEGIRHFAGETIGVVGGEEAAEGCVELMSSAPSNEVKQASIRALGHLKADGRDRSEIISEYLEVDDFATRLAAIQALKELCAASEAGELGNLCEDAVKAVRQAAVSALATMGAEGAAEALRFFDDSDWEVRQAAVKVYSPLHSKLRAEHSRPHAMTVAEKLTDEDWRVRCEAAKAIGDLHANECASQLAALVSDDNDQVRRNGITALEKFGKESVPLLEPFTEDQDRRVKEDAERALRCLQGS